MWGLSVSRDRARHNLQVQQAGQLRPLELEKQTLRRGQPEMLESNIRDFPAMIRQTCVVKLGDPRSKLCVVVGLNFE